MASQVKDFATTDVRPVVPDFSTPMPCIGFNPSETAKALV
jgi:hypothetical protein